ncbi:MAG: phosphopantothenoylcysteine decarboxylase, partial [Solimonas sp.]
QNIIENAKVKLAEKGCDLIIANDVSADKGVMGGERNTVHLVSATGVESWPELDKREVARRLMEDFARRIGAKA